MDPDINKYDLDHRVSHHPKMSDAEWEGGGRRGAPTTRPSTLYDFEARGRTPNGRPKQIASTIMWFKLMIEHEGVHPLEGGAFRLKSRRDRRHGLKLELPLVLYSRATPARSCSRRGNIGGSSAADETHPERGACRPTPHSDLFPRASGAARADQFITPLGRSRARPHEARGQHSRIGARPRRPAARRINFSASKPLKSEPRAPSFGWSQAKLAERAGRDGRTLRAGTRPSPWRTRSPGCAGRLSRGRRVHPKNGGGGAGVRLRKGREAKFIGWEDLNASNDE